MKLRSIAILLLICIMVCLLPLNFNSSAAGTCFIAINETFQPLTSQPYFSGSVTYLPYWVFTSLGLSYSYFAESSTALAYSSTNQIFFELSTGNTSDANGNTYSTQAVFHNGTVYLPAKFICDQFGYQYSYIVGNEYGDIVRIKSGAILSDQEFLNAGGIKMRALYNDYYGTTTSTPTPTATPSPTPSPSPTPTFRQDTTVFLCFNELPSEDILNTLTDNKLSAFFFLTEQAVTAEPELVRSLVVAGHSIGVFCSSNFENDYNKISQLIFEAARIRPTIVTSPADDMDACREFAKAAGLVCYEADIYAVNGSEPADAASVTSIVEISSKSAGILMDCGKTTEDILPAIASYLVSSKYTVRQFRETDSPN